MKKIFIAFDYLFIEHHTSVDVEEAIYSSNDDEDFIIFVMNEDATVDDYHELDKQFTLQCTSCSYHQSSNYFDSQIKFKDADRVNNMMNSIRQEVDNVIKNSFSDFTKYNV